MKTRLEVLTSFPEDEEVPVDLEEVFIYRRSGRLMLNFLLKMQDEDQRYLWRVSGGTLHEVK